MPRAPFQILVLPYRRVGESFEFAVFSRQDYPCWQGIAGGGEHGETPMEAAVREAHEEAGIPAGSRFLPLDTTCSVPVTRFKQSHLWGESLYVIPEYSFGVDCTEEEVKISSEHTKFKWLSFSEATKLLKYDSNRTALWELNQKIQVLGPRDKEPNKITERTTGCDERQG